MSLFNSQARYGAVAQSLHWLTAFLVAFAWILGQVGEDLGGEGPRAAGIVAHVMVGLGVLAVLAARLAWRLADAPPSPETTRLGAWADRAAVLVHYALLALLLAVPLAGLAYQIARGEPIYLFGLAEIASPVSLPRATSRNIKEAHEVLSNVLLIFVLLHAAAALFHHWMLRDNVLRRMWPFGG